jgi:hypothetical protein
MHKNTTKYNETLSKWCKNKHEASKIIDTLETYQDALEASLAVTINNPKPYNNHWFMVCGKKNGAEQ